MNTITIDGPGLAILNWVGRLSKKFRLDPLATPKFSLGQQIYFVRYDLIHCAFVERVTMQFDKEWSFFYQPDNAQEEEDIVPEEACFATLDELIEDLKSKMIVSQML